MKTVIKKTKLSYIISLPQIEDEGFLSFAEEKHHLPFEIKRFYYIYDVVKNAKRGFHAHKKTKQVLFCVRGSIKVHLDNGVNREVITLDKPNKGIYLDKLMWHEMHDFTDETLLLVAASERYIESDYIRDYKVFIETVNAGFWSRFAMFYFLLPKLDFMKNK
jgi:dTDP-4-dehydrorhamnose 3,5-epimerase-like enzyme